MILGREPVMFSALVAAIIYLLTEFGITITDGQQAAIMAVTLAVLGLITRSKVTPTTSG